MYQVKCLNKISPLGTSRLGENYQVGEDVENPDAILVRSAAMHDMEFNKNLLVIFLLKDAYRKLLQYSILPAPMQTL